jgi:hypothetical protein
MASGYNAQLERWTWTCHECGWYLNTNQDPTCQECGAQIRCEDAGGHHGKENGYCDRGCGYHMETHKTDLTKRRENY